MFTASEAAEYKGVHLKSVYRAMSANRLPWEERYGVKVISQVALDAWEPRLAGPRVLRNKPTESA